jgi:hypothetical protein
LILDSPNNVESDDDKKRQLFNYLFNCIDKDTQMIVSTLGFNKNDYPNIEFNRIMELQNNKYELLNVEEFEENKKILVDLSSSTMQ